MEILGKGESIYVFWQRWTIARCDGSDIGLGWKPSLLSFLGHFYSKPFILFDNKLPAVVADNVAVVGTAVAVDIAVLSKKMLKKKRIKL